MIWAVILSVITCLILIFRGSEWEGSLKKWQVVLGVFEAGVGVAGLISISLFLIYRAFFRG